MLRWLGRNALRAYTGLALVYLLLPIFIVAIFSFNDPVGKTNYTWVGFTLDRWANLFAIPGLLDSVIVSLRIAFISTLIATALGTLAALALVRRSALDAAELYAGGADEPADDKVALQMNVPAGFVAPPVGAGGLG